MKLLPTHAFCPNCQRVKEVEKVHRKLQKKPGIVLKCCDCGYVAGVRVANPPKKVKATVNDFRGPVKKHGRTIIYDKILKIEAQKGDKSLWPKDLFVHKFTGKDAEVLGNQDGSLTVKSRSGKKLWKNIEYGNKRK